jgi:hypothetical protein
MTMGCWSLGLQLKNLNKGFNTKSPEIRPFAVGLLGVLFFILTYEGIVMTVSTLIFLLKMVDRIKLVRGSFAITPSPGEAAQPTLTFTTNENDGVEFFQHILQTRFVEKCRQEYGAKRGSREVPQKENP